MKNENLKRIAHVKGCSSSHGGGYFFLCRADPQRDRGTKLWDRNIACVVQLHSPLNALMAHRAHVRCWYNITRRDRVITLS